MSDRGRQVVIWVVGILVTVAMLGLGIWQANRFENTGQDAMTQRMLEPARPLDEFLASDLGLTSAYGHRVTVTGRYVDEPQLLADPESPHRVVSAFELENGTVLPVVRGGTGDQEVTVPPTGEVELEGILLDTDPEGPRAQPREGVIPGFGFVDRDKPPPEPYPVEGTPRPHRDTVPVDQLVPVESVRLPVIAQTWPREMLGGYLTVTAWTSTQEGLSPVMVPVPDNAEGQARNRGYSLQWWLFAIVAMAATIKLSHDAARNVGFMRRPEPGEDSDE